MTATVKGGFGVQSGLIGVSSVVGGNNAVTANVGMGIQAQVGNAPIRLSSLRYRIDLAPDVPAGSVSAPTKWRVVVFTAAQFPNDISVMQAQAYPGGSHPEIPTAQGVLSPLTILADIWLDAVQGDPGFNSIASEEWNDAGPTAFTGILCVLVIPLIDANIDQSVKGSANANVYVEAYGREIVAGSVPYSSAGSVPRYAVEVPE